MKTEEVLQELKSYADANYKKLFVSLGAREPYFGVRIGDMKKIQKKVKKDHELALSLYATGNSDAMYFAGLIADEKKMTKEDLRRWLAGAYWDLISEYTVPWVASETPYGFELGLEWIESKEERIAAAGWATLASYASVRQDAELDVPAYSKLLDRVVKDIHKAQNRVRYTMNTFVISTGIYITSLTAKATESAKKIGKVSVNMGDTACKVPSAPDYIKKAADRGNLGKKRKTARC